MSTPDPQIIALRLQVRALQTELAYIMAEQHATERVLLVSQRVTAQLRYALAPCEQTRAVAACAIGAAEVDLASFKGKIR